MATEKIKVFTTEERDENKFGDLEKLEKRVNEWFLDNVDIEIIDRKMSAIQGVNINGFNSMISGAFGIYTIVIFYRQKE